MTIAPLFNLPDAITRWVKILIKPLNQTQRYGQLYHYSNTILIATFHKTLLLTQCCHSITIIELSVTGHFIGLQFNVSTHHTETTKTYENMRCVRKASQRYNNAECALMRYHRDVVSLIIRRTVYIIHIFDKVMRYVTYPFRYRLLNNNVYLTSHEDLSIPWHIALCSNLVRACIWDLLY